VLIDIVQECSSGGEEKVIEIVDGLPVGGVVHHLLALLEQGFETVVKKRANLFGTAAGCHKYLHVWEK
jgi:hypothetical protein